MGPAEVASHNTAESLLSSRVPYLEFHRFSVHEHFTIFEVDADSGHCRLGEVIAGEAVDDGRLADFALSDQQQLEGLIHRLLLLLRP